MRLSKVRINNFKGIKDWEIDLKPGFNLVKGTNGKGKTSILEAIAVGMGGFLTGIAGISGRNFIREEIRREYVLSGDGSYTCLYKIPVEIGLTATFEDGAEVTIEALVEEGIIKNPRDGVKILGNGELTKKLTVKVTAVSASAAEKIEALGGKVEVK